MARDDAGFSLVELLISLSIGVLMSGTIPLFIAYQVQNLSKKFVNIMEFQEI